MTLTFTFNQAAWNNPQNRPHMQVAEQRGVTARAVLHSTGLSLVQLLDGEPEDTVAYMCV